MKHIVMTKEIAHAASQDAANRSMRKAGRKSWNVDDYNVAVDEYNRLWPEEYDTTDPRTEAP